MRSEFVIPSLGPAYYQKDDDYESRKGFKEKHGLEQEESGGWILCLQVITVTVYFISILIRRK